MEEFPGYPTVRTWIHWFCVAVLASVLGFAGIIKIADPQGFAESIRNFRLIPEWSVALVTFYLPWFELAVVLSLLVPKTRLIGFVFTIGLLVVFLLALGSAELRGLDISCGCFGSRSPSARMTSVLDSCLLLIAGVGAWTCFSRSQTALAPVD